MHENQKEAIVQLNQISKFQQKMMKYTAPSKGMVQLINNAGRDSTGALSGSPDIDRI